MLKTILSSLPRNDITEMKFMLERERSCVYSISC